MTDRARRGIRIFDGADATPLHTTDMMSMPTFEGDVPDDLDDWYRSRGQEVTVLYRDPDEQGVSLVMAAFSEGYVLPRHSHSADCLYFVLSGSALLGNRTVTAGSGFFVPAGAPYAYEAGPGGVQVLEFRNASSFDMRISENMAGWGTVLEAVRSHADEWREAALHG